MRYVNPYIFSLLVGGSVTIVLGVIVFMVGRNDTKIAGNTVITQDATAMWNGLIDQQFGIAIATMGALALIGALVVLGLQWRSRP